MPVRMDTAWWAFHEAMNHIEQGVRLKDIREREIVKGRAKLSLFERAPVGDRPHPRLRMAFRRFDDPAPPPLPAPEAWADVEAFRSWLEAALSDPGMTAGLDRAPTESPRYWFNSLRSRRIGALLEHASAALDTHPDWSSGELSAARYALAERGALAYTGLLVFDDDNTGTYHSFLHDQPFVHVLEQLRASLPEAGSTALSVLPSVQQFAVRRQHGQLTHHLDFLMRHKYANTGVTESDIERTVGGLLIDRETRQIASEDPASRDSLLPRHELLRIDPSSEHANAGAWVMRTEDGFALRDGSALEIDEDQLLRTQLSPERLTFERALGDPRLRADMRLDWNGDGWVDTRPLEWISWAGHCDIKAVLEELGLAMLDQQSVFEYRSDTGQVIELTRKLLLELLSGVCEFGSVYERMDGRGVFVRGIHRFGGFRNDSMPDRLQFRGQGPGAHFRWPISTKREALQIKRMRDAGQQVDLDTAFFRYIADIPGVDFAPNPRYLRTVEGDHNVIDATGMVLTGEARVSSFDRSGQLKHAQLQIEIDLRPENTGRSFLGTELRDAGTRELYRVYLDHAQPAIVAELWRWDPSTGDEVHDEQGDIELALLAPLSTTLSREQKLDDPAAFRTLLELALEQGQNISVDTDAEAPVWNGVVTRMEVERVAVNEAARVERWRVAIDGRFGSALLGYMVRRDRNGEPEVYCPVVDEEGAPDFLWQDLPDIASKGIEQGAWVVNQAMRERKIVRVRQSPSEPGGWYVEDEHIKNAFELIYAALAGYQYTIVHQNKRYVFADEAAWAEARAELDTLRGQLSFE